MENIYAFLHQRLRSFFLWPPGLYPSWPIIMSSRFVQRKVPYQERQQPVRPDWRVENGQIWNRDWWRIERDTLHRTTYYHRCGTLSAQASNPDKTVPDSAYTVNGYEALYGDIKIDDVAGRFILRWILHCQWINWSKMERAFHLTGNKLELSPVDKGEGCRDLRALQIV